MADILGTENDDILDGTTGEDLINGLGGNDTISGGIGNDEINGSDGNDIISGGNDNDTISGGAGNDEINGGNGDDVIDGGTGNDIINAGNNDDTVRGGDGDDTIEGGSGNDIIYGGLADTSAGNVLKGSFGNDVFHMEGGLNKAYGSWDTDTFIIYQNSPNSQAFEFTNLDTDESIFLNDIIYDFDPSTEVIDLSNIVGVNSFADLQISAQVTADVLDGSSPFLSQAEIIQISIIDGYKEALTPADDMFTVSGTLSDVTGNVLVDNGNGADTGEEVSVVAGTYATDQGGSVMIAADGSFTYTPDAAFDSAVGDSFNYTLQDQYGEQKTASVTIEGLRTFNDLFYDADFSDGVTGNVLVDNGNGADTGKEINAVAGTYATDEGGSVTIAADGSFTYSAGTNTNAFDKFTYDIIDSEGATITGTVDLIEGYAPVIAQDDIIYKALADTSVSGNVLTDNGNGADSGNGLIVTAGTIDTFSGSVNMAADGSFTYTHGFFFFGFDNFEYEVTDSAGNVTTARVDIVEGEAPTTTEEESGGEETSGLVPNIVQTFTLVDVEGSELSEANFIFAPNNAPVAVDDSLTTNEGTALSFTTADLLINDTDVEDGTPDFSQVLTGPQNGTLSDDGSGNYTYTPNANYSGADSFTYEVIDSFGDKTTATVAITVDPAVVNIVTGTPDDDVLQGTAGDDEVSALAGNDRVVASDGEDILDGGADNDTVDYSNNAQGARIDLGLRTADKDGDGAADDSILNFENVVGSAHDDVIRGNSGDNVLEGGDGVDDIRGGNGNDTIRGGDGNDSILFGANGDDTVYGDGGNDDVRGGFGNDMLYGGTGNDNLNGQQDDDMLFGGLGADRLYGELGNDVLNGEEGDDYLSGKEGNDTLNGGADNDTLVGHGGMDILNGGTGNDTLYASEGNDTLNGGDGDDNLYGGDGDDTIIADADAGSDYINGGTGVDTLDFTAWTQAVNVDLTVNGVDADGNGVYEDTVINVEKILGTSFGDTIRANGYTDVDFNGLDGNDRLYGNSLADTLRGGEGNDYLQGNGNDDTLYGDGGNDDLRGNSGDDTLYGGDGTDFLRGQQGNDILYGEGDADTLLGLQGNDMLYGGGGKDYITGGSGADTFAFEAATAFDNFDVIQDFSLTDGDMIDISDVLSGYDPLTDAITDFVHIASDGTHSYLRVDADGGADNFVQIARLSNVTGLANEDTLVTDGSLIV